MIVDFHGKKITDNTAEIENADLFLLTDQNRKYFSHSCETITPKELIEELQLQNIKIIGITGTNGKTTTAAAIYSLLNDLGFKAALQGTRGFFVADEQLGKKSLTTPSILETVSHLFAAKQRGCDYFCMEVSSHAIVQNRIEGLDFSLKVFTNISQDHLDYHKTLQKYVAAKSAFFADESTKLINKEDKNLQYNLKNTRTYAVEEPATYQIVAYSLENGISGVIQFGSQMADFHSSLQGLFNLYNLTAAIGAVHIVTNEELQKICDVVENFAGVKGRMEVVSTKPLIIIDFAHTPDGMQKVFESFPGKKIVAVFGAGGERDRDKRAKMGNIASRFCTRIYLTNDNPRRENPSTIIEDIAQGINTDIQVEKIEDRKEAIKRAIKNLKKDEILLILGKGDEEYMEIEGEKIPFNDRDIVEQIIES
ncbi:UDP-N-acetylmuramoyl-L-alanyl-D-glutamate--2,6-diaminopimelate ligase [Nitratiruptor tergarcus]|uniref:UDP-N-acetylmuramoyl-L-alanyl-D-glutamate--2,6-diaminopimelate ligase n=1 Tax=Nitratiruptor tergarcus DSM 16512 TaxID=1069081 RepID=A0A1W1WRV3_9BACT|nr:UDP-N-acetylmuramoyl-L-alanyl-D-glutamate--2,6-diaminopimelate ligase [Nitratiruptor tergarcus]SMC08935.1 UDP-N-acetylmuramoylalanyl-D-glutamate--2,6-diaminopimelate ligase [Nitratiruptor tergarcus DSM 16512]